MSDKKFTRRELLKGAAAGAAGLASAQMLGFTVNAAPVSASEPSGKVYNEPASWDYEADVVTIGTGTSMYGVIKMAKEGLDVIAIDAFAVAGGSAAFSGAVLWLPNSRFAIELGDSREKAYAYIRNDMGTGKASDEQIYAFLDNVNPMLEYIDPIMLATSQNVGVAMAKFPDYHPHWENGMNNGRSVVWFPGGDSSLPRNAAAWAGAYCEAAQTCGAKIMTSTKATKFVYRYDESGLPEVLGVIAEQGGKEIALKAKKAVLFAPGGFEWNFDLQKAYLSIPGSYPCSTSTNDGTAFKAVMALSPELNNMANQFGHVCAVEKARDQFATGAPVNMFWGRHYPHTFVVNKLGMRFFNESCCYPTAHKQFYNRTSYGENGCINLPCWMICDQQFVEGVAEKNYVIGSFMTELDERGVHPSFRKADTIEELAEIVGINKENLLETAKRFNTYVEQGCDDDFHRGDSAFETEFFMADFSKEGVYRVLGTVEKGPFYAVELAPSTLGTCGGPNINGKAQVLHISDKPIKRLYGCGNGTGYGGPGQGYGGAGGTLGVGFVMGFVAATTIVENETADWQ